MQKAELCPAGYVCLTEGLSGPVLECPAGYWCNRGTMTLSAKVTYGFVSKGIWDVISEYSIEPMRQSLLLKLKATLNPTYHAVQLLPLQPLACNPGTYCLGGEEDTAKA